MRNTATFLILLVFTFGLSSLTTSGFGKSDPEPELGAERHHHGGHGVSTSQFMAPAWEALAADNEVIGASDFLGEPYVLILHLGHSCFHCSKQLGHFNKVSAKFRDLNTDVIAIGMESTKQLGSAQGTTKSKDASIQFGVDPTKEIFRQFNAVDQQNAKPLHATFLIDAIGRIRWSDIGPHPFMNSDALIKEVSLIRSGSTTAQEDDRPDRPKVFLDKNPRIVAYQLKRLNNERLLLVERKTTDPKYVPVFEAILNRAGMSPQYREEALAALAVLNNSDSASELLKALSKIPATNRQQRQTAGELTKLLFEQPMDVLKARAAAFKEATEADSAYFRRVGFAGLVMTGNEQQAWEIAKGENEKEIDYLNSIQIVKKDDLRSTYRDQIWELFQSQEEPVRKGAIRAMEFLPTGQDKVFSELEPLVSDERFRVSAVASMLKVPEKVRDSGIGKKAVGSLLKYAEATPTEDRTSDQFLDAMQLADQLLKQLTPEEAKNFRSKLSEVSVRVVKISTLEDEMLYDIPFFAVEAGRSVQIVLDIIDLMAHNLVICKPGKMRDVAADGLAAGPKNGMDGKQYVPKSDDVLAATDMVQAHQRGRITFEAPKKPGEYPYVCTFPQHWLRMYGVMVVVEDLDQWLKNPVKPTDPLGNKRQFVKKWTVDELVDGLPTQTGSPSLESGKKIFTEATCASCHKLGGEGGAIGPALDEVVKRWKGDKRSLIREIIEPSHRIDEKYSMHVIATLDGQTISGIIQSENEDEIELLDNAASTVTIKVAKDDIDEMIKTSKSMMPKALMDNFTQEEIGELLHYIEASQKD